MAEQSALFPGQTHSKAEAQVQHIVDTLAQLRRQCPTFDYELGQFQGLIRRKVDRSCTAQEREILRAINNGYETAQAIARRTLIRESVVRIRLTSLAAQGRIEKRRREISAEARGNYGGQFEFVYTLALQRHRATKAEIEQRRQAQGSLLDTAA